MEAASITWRPLGRLLVEQGLLNHLELEAAMVEQEQTGRRLGGILVARGYITTSALAAALAEQLGIDLPAEQPDQGPRRPVLRLVRSEEEPAVAELPPRPVPTLESYRSRLEQAQLAVVERDARIAELEEALDLLQGGPRASPRGHVLLVPGRNGYELVPQGGGAPVQGGSLTVGDERFLVGRLGRSPLPGDPRPCAFLLRG